LTGISAPTTPHAAGNFHAAIRKLSM